jgi:hypothetical protein
VVSEIVGDLNGSVVEVSGACTSIQIHIRIHKSSIAADNIACDNEVSRFDSEHDNNVLYQGC